jgi:hypothetical protein
MQRKLARTFALCTILVMLLACSIPVNLLKSLSGSNPTQDATALNIQIQTHIAETRAADPANILKTVIAATQAALPQVVPTTAVPPPVIVPTQTPNVVLPPTMTPTSEKVYLTLSKNSYCRSGPATTFARITTIFPTARAEVIARNPGNDWYYINHPNAPGNFCWVSGLYATLTGNVNGLPVRTH